MKLMKFRVKDMDITTGDVLVAILNQHDANNLDLKANDRIIVKYKNKEITCMLDISENGHVVPNGKLGLFEEVLDRLNVKNNALVEIKFTGKPESVKHIRDKLYGKRLSYK